MNSIRTRYYKKNMIQILLIPVLLLVTACTAIGPPTVARDRFRLRQCHVRVLEKADAAQPGQDPVPGCAGISRRGLGDQPVFPRGRNIFRGVLGPPIDGDSQTVGGTGRYADRPTITYAPISGARFTQQLMTPIPVAAILALLQSGYPADFVFRIGVQTINGVNNRFGGQIMQRHADPEFYELLRTLSRIQRLDGLGMRVKSEDDKSAVVLFFKSDADADLSEDLALVEKILRVSLIDDELNVVFGSVPKNDRELAIQTRSMLQIIIELASHIDVPAKDVAEGRVFAAPRKSIPDFSDLITIHSGAEHPADSYAAIRYRDMWFWIDDRDLDSKRIFAFTMLLFSLTETEGDQRAPIVTVPAS